MADPLLGLIEPVVGSPAAKNTWGTSLNTNFSLIGAAVTGDNSYGGGSGSGIDIAGLTTYALTTTAGAANQARQPLYPFTGALTEACTVTIASSVKIGWALNATTGSQDVILTSGGGATLILPPDGLWHFFYADGNGNVTAPGFGLSALTVGTLDVTRAVTFNITSLSLTTLSVAGVATLSDIVADSLSVAGTAAITGTPGSNTGNGTIGSLSLETGPRVGNYTVTLSSATAFTVTDPLSNTVGTGTVGSAFTTQIGFTITAGSIAFVNADSFTVSVLAASIAAIGSPHGGNTGNGTVGQTSTLTGVRLGTYVATFTSATAFNVTDPLNSSVSTGTAGTPFATQIGFTITAGTTPFVSGDYFNFVVSAATSLTGPIATDGTVIPYGGTLPVNGAVTATGAVTGGGGLFASSVGVTFPDTTVQATAATGGIAPSPSGLVISVTSSTAITVTATALAVLGSGQSRNLTSFNQSIATGTAGAGGLDTGSIAAGKVYNVFAIYGTSGTAAMLSLSATAPTMPSGYTYFSRLGAVITAAGSAVLLGTLQKGRRAQYLVGGANLSALPAIETGASGSVSSPTWTAFNVVSGTQPLVPPTASAIRLLLVNATTGTDTVMVAPNNSYGNQFSISNPAPMVMYSSNAPRVTMGDLILESVNVYYAASGGNVGAFVFGWEDNT